MYFWISTKGGKSRYFHGDAANSTHSCEMNNIDKLPEISTSWENFKQTAQLLGGTAHQMDVSAAN